MAENAGVSHADAEKLYTNYWPMVLKRCRQLLGDADSAADAAQEVFVKILDRRGTLNAEHPSSLLWTTATRHCLDKLRSRARRARAETRDNDKNAGAPDIETEIAGNDLLQKLFERLPKKSRAAAILHFADGMSVRETARAMNMSVGGTHERLRALREMLRQTLKQLDSE